MGKVFRSMIFGLIIIAFLSSCGGGGGGGSSSGGGASVVKITVGSGGQTAKLRANEKNTFLARVKDILIKLLPDNAVAAIPSSVYRIVFSISGTGMTTLTRDVSVAGRTEITETFSVPNGSSRVFVISEYDSSGYLVYRGETTANLSGGTVELPVTVKTRATALSDWLEKLRIVLNRKPNLTAADLDPFFSANFGINDGRDRAREIADWIKPGEGPPTDIKKITGYSELFLEPLSSGSYKIKGKMLFEDGSYLYFDLVEFLLAYEDNTFKIKGNNYKSQVEIRAESHKWIDLTGAFFGSSPPPAFVTGLYIDINDKSSDGSLQSAVVEGPGLPSGFVTLTKVTDKTYFALDDPPYRTSLPTGSYELYVMNNDADINSIPLDVSYTVTIRNTSNVVVETRTIRLPMKPFTNAELASVGYFPSLTLINGNTPAAAYNAISAANIGGTLTFSYNKPTAFSPIWMEADLNYWDGSGSSADKWVDLLLTQTSGSITTTLPSWTATRGHLEITAEDSNNRRTVYHWLFQ